MESGGNRECGKRWKRLPERAEGANKGSYGKVLIIAGSRGMCGAAFLAGLSAYRSGAGLIKLLTAEDNRTILQTLLPEAVLSVWKREEELPLLLEKEADWADFLVMGPGLGTEESAFTLVREALSVFSCPMLLDADCLNILARDGLSREKLKRAAAHLPILLTPHPMEMARLCGCSLETVLSDPETAARDFSLEMRVLTLLKGSNTCIASEKGELWKNTEASPALAKAGSGDVLSGCIAGIYEILAAEERLGTKTGLKGDTKEIPSAGGMDQKAFLRLYRAGIAGVLSHAEAGRLAARRLGHHGVLARDTADMLGAAIESGEFLYE